MKASGNTLFDKASISAHNTVPKRAVVSPEASDARAGEPCRCSLKGEYSDQRASMPENTITMGASTPAIIAKDTIGSSDSAPHMRPDSRKQSPASTAQKMPVRMEAFNNIALLTYRRYGLKSIIRLLKPF